MDSSSSSSSSFIASGCSSPATLRRSGGSSGSSGSSGGSTSTTRSLPMAKRKPLLNADPHRQPNRSISLQETHSGAALEEVKEVIDENEDNAKATASALPESPSPSAALRPCPRGFFSSAFFFFFAHFHDFCSDLHVIYIFV